MANTGLQISNGVCTKNDTVTILFNSFLLSPGVNELNFVKEVLPVLYLRRARTFYGMQMRLGVRVRRLLPVPSAADTGRVIHWVSQTIRRV